MTQTAEHDLVLVVDFGAQYAQLIARRVREARVYSEIVPHTMPVAEMLARRPEGDRALRRPVLGVRRGRPRDRRLGLHGRGPGLRHVLRLPADGARPRRRGRPDRRPRVRPDAGQRRRARHAARRDPRPSTRVWMSHGDSVTAAPEGFSVLASTAVTPVAAFEDVERRLAGVQWHPEVMHTEHGQQVLEHFLLRIAGCRPTWTMVNIVEEQIERIREQVGETGRAICGLSGGVDSAVAAALVQRAIGDRLDCVFVDHGLLRQGEAEQVERDFVAATGVNLHVVECSERFLDALAGVSDPEEKRKIIGREFIRVFEAAEAAGARRRRRQSGDKVAFLVQGTLYPDVVESGGGAGTSNIKSHHNVGGLPDDLEFELVEPLRTLFKDEVRLVGEQLGLPAEIVHRQPVPRPRPGHPDHRRGHPRAARHPARGRRDRPRGADPRRPRPRHLADAGGAAGRRPLGRRPGRRPHLRPPGRAAPGHLRGRDDRRLGAAAVRGAWRRSPPGSPTRSPRSTGSPSTSPPSRPAPSSGSSDHPLALTDAEKTRSVNPPDGSLPGPGRGGTVGSPTVSSRRSGHASCVGPVTRGGRPGRPRRGSDDPHVRRRSARARPARRLHRRGLPGPAGAAERAGVRRG